MSEDKAEDLGLNAPIAFNVNDAAIAEIAEQCKGIDAYEDFEAAKKAKKGLTKMRTALGEAHREAKADALAYGRRCDTEKNRLLEAIARIEDPITKQLTDIKEEEERLETIRLEAIEDALQFLRNFAEDRHSLTLEQLEERQALLQIELITEEVYQESIETAELTKGDSELKLRMAIDAEKTRLEEAEKQARIEEENRELREKLAEAEKEKAAEEEKRQAEEAERQKARDEEAAKEREAEEERRKTEQERIDKENERLAEEQRKIDEENARLAKEKQDKEDAERKAEEDREAAERALRLAPDSEKLTRWAELIDNIVRPEVESDEAGRIVTLARERLHDIIEYIYSETEKLK